jgi:serine/threonine protein kinase
LPSEHSHRYQMQHLLSESTESKLFVAIQHSPNRIKKQVLICCMPAPERSPDSPPALMLREHITTAALHHSAIVQTLDASRNDEFYFLVYEYSPGPDLEELLTRVYTRGLHMPVDVALHIGRQIAAALCYAHTRPWRPKGSVGYHGSLSPAKVHLSLSGNVKLRGFGAGPAATPYRCPEQLRAPAGSTLGDLFSIGTLLFETLCGERPFDGATEHEVVESLATCQPPALRTLRPDAPAALESLVSRCLHSDPAQRYHQAGELLSDLQSLMHYRQVDDGAALLRDCIIDAFPERTRHGTQGVVPRGAVPPWEALSHRLSARLVELPRSMNPIRSTQVRLIRTETIHHTSQSDSVKTESLPALPNSIETYSG